METPSPSAHKKSTRILPVPILLYSPFPFLIRALVYDSAVMKILSLALLCVALSALAGAPECTSVASCNTMGTKELAAGRPKLAILLFESQAGYAEEADMASSAPGFKNSLVAYNNLVLACLKDKDPLMARAWLELALDRDPQNKAALFNKTKVDEAMQGFSLPAKVTGTYRRYAGAGTWDDAEIAETGGGQIRFSFTLVRMGLNWRAYGPAAIGEISGTAKLANGKAAFSQKSEYGEKPCALGMTFEKGKLTVKQDGTDSDCGFGAGVTAEGTYLLTSTKEPPPPGKP